MASNVVRVSLLAEEKAFIKGFANAQKSATTFGAAVGTMAGNLATSLGQKALSAVQQFVTDSVTAFSELEQSMGGTEAIFGDNADAIENWADRSASALGLSEAEFRTATTSIGGQLKRMTGDVEFAAEHAVELTQVAADLAATFGGTTAEAVAALGSAFRGEADPAERFNLNLKQSAVNAKAVEMGLATAGGEVDDAAKAQAILALVTEQSADAQGQFARESDTVAGRTQILNAELEDQKALMGKSLVPLWNKWLEVQSDALPLLGGVAIGLAEITGELSRSQSAVAEWEMKNEKAAETWGDIFAALKDDTEVGLVGQALDVVATHTDRFTRHVVDAIDTWALGGDELDKFAHHLEILAESGQITEEQFETFTEAVEKKRTALKLAAEAANDDTRMMQNVARATGKAVGPTDDLAGAQDDLADKVKTTTDLIKDQIDLLRAQTDPVFAYMDATNDLAEAQAAYDKALVDTSADSPEAVAAAADIADAQLRIRDAVNQIGPSIADQQAALAALGVPPAVIAKFSADAARIKEIFDNLKLRIGVSAPTLFPTTPASGGIGWKSETKTFFHQGGVVPGVPGQDVPAVLKAGETVLPTHDKNAMRGLGPSVFNITINAGMGADPNSISRAVVQSLQRYERANGAIPINTRQP